MSKKKKHKKNKNLYSQPVQVTNESVQATASDNNSAEQKLLTADEGFDKLENKPVDLLGGSGSVAEENKTESSTENETSTIEMEFKTEAIASTNEDKTSEPKSDLVEVISSPTESKMADNETEDQTTSNFVPFWIGIIVGAILMYLFL
ncbi:MAG: hypothetical protein H6779_04240 [Candidatus Nomurabacteria bacterium]|nr:MAG: hypothetical protein H6779_04240 [Candidatus Nomurabacteria bacterium]